MKKPVVNSIITKLFIVCFTFIIIPMMSTVYFSFVSYKNNVEDVARDNTIKIMKNVNGILDELALKMRDVTFMLYKSRSKFGSFNANAFDYLAMTPDSEIDQRNKESIIYDFLDSLFDFEPNYIFCSFIIDKAGKCYYASNKKMPSSIKYDYDFAGQSWYQEIVDSNIRLIQIKTCGDVPRDFLFMPNSDNLIMIARNIYNVDSIYSTNCIGTIFIYVNANFFDRYVRLDDSVAQKISIVDKDGYVVYSTDKNSINLKSGMEDEIRAFDSSVGTFEAAANSNKYMISYMTNKQTGWRIEGETDRKLLTREIDAIRGNAIVIMVLTMFIAALVFKLLYNLTAHPVKVIARNMKKIEEGNFERFDTVKSKDEFEKINAGLMTMAENLKEYIDKAYIAEIKKHEANLYALQSQIKPHFILNVLETVRMRLISQNDRNTAEIIKRFGKVVRVHLTNFNEIVTVENELELTSNYFQVELYRFGEKLSMDIDIPDSVKHYRIPQMIIQPIVENALKHGLGKKVGKGIIKITAYYAERFLKIAIMDNGMGMSAERLAEVNESLQIDDLELNGKNIGLRNVHSKVKNYFGKEYGISLSSIEGEGTIVEIMLPYPEKEALPNEYA